MGNESEKQVSPYGCKSSLEKARYVFTFVYLIYISLKEPFQLFYFTECDWTGTVLSSPLPFAKLWWAGVQLQFAWVLHYLSALPPSGEQNESCCISPCHNFHSFLTPPASPAIFVHELEISQIST